MILFLDFDGVLHAVDDDDNLPASQRHFYRAPLLRDLLRRLPQIRVVVVSAWRLDHRLESLANFVVGQAPDSEELRSRFIGITPELDPAQLNRILKIPYGMRLAEIEAWCNANNYEGPWIALDDKPSLFFQSAAEEADYAARGQRLIVCDPQRAMEPWHVEHIVRYAQQ